MTRTPPTPATVRKRLLRWYDSSRRDLPWRRTNDPYAVWISETMLQQTRVETVIPYYERFLRDFPDVQTLADADEEAVLERWAGLGYYSRARNLHRAARQLTEQFEGRLPSDAEALRSLPGVGRYTAGAVASIAFDRREPIVDGNVARVLSRLHGIRKPVSDTATRARLWEEAAALADGDRPGDLNQALMELGAVVCTPRSPTCMLCPLVSLCDAHAQGDAESVPPRAKKKPVPIAYGVAALVVRRGRTLMVRRASGGLLGGLWELPGTLVDVNADGDRAITQAVRTRTGLEAAGLEARGEVEHVFTHRILRLRIYATNDVRGRVRLADYEQARWLSDSEFDGLARSTLTKKALAVARGVEAKRGRAPRRRAIIASARRA